MKWGTEFPPHYVNILYNAVVENVSGPVRFVCLTDDYEGIRSEIECFPIPDLLLEKTRYDVGAWPKLGVYSETLYDLNGRVLFIDLDTIINGNLDPFFEYEGEFCALLAWPNWKAKWRIKRFEAKPGTGVFAFNIGEQVQILNNFMSNKELAFSMYQNEQQFLHAHVRGLRFWPADWVISFKRHLRQGPVLDRIFKPIAPESKNLIVAFHGNPRPHCLVPEEGQQWAKWPRNGRGTVDWVRQNWLKYDYKDAAKFLKFDSED